MANRPSALKLGLAAAALLLALLLPAAPGVAAADYEAYGSCATAKPYPEAGRCAFDGPEHAQGTIVFRSHVGKRMLKVCQRIYGLSFKGSQCLKTKSATAYEAIPFELDHAYARFKLVVTFYAMEPGAGGSFDRAQVTLRFKPAR
jgi:hypothetical protein